MTSGFIVATLMVIGYSLWVRRDTWWSRWEAAASLALALEACALVLMSPWAAREIGPILHHNLGVWNTQQLLGHLCLIAAVTANIHHMLVRLADPDQVRLIMRRQLLLPVSAGVTVMVPCFLLSDQSYRPDLFAATSSDHWIVIYELVGCTVVLFLSGYVSRLMLALRHDPRARTTIHLYLASMTFASAACLIVVASSLIDGDDASTAIWACICLSVGIFGYGSARSWREKSAWFSASRTMH